MDTHRTVHEWTASCRWIVPSFRSKMTMSPFVQPRRISDPESTMLWFLPTASNGFQSFQFFAVIGGHMCKTYGLGGGANITPARGIRLPLVFSMAESTVWGGDKTFWSRFQKRTLPSVRITLIPISSLGETANEQIRVFLTKRNGSE